MRAWQAGGQANNSIESHIEWQRVEAETQMSFNSIIHSSAMMAFISRVNHTPRCTAMGQAQLKAFASFGDSGS